MVTAELEDILDLNTLEQYCDAIGAETLLKSVVLFEQLMPEYLNGLRQASSSQEKQDLCSQAHKFKGASGSIGLKRLQHYAQLLQHGEAADWNDMHQQWLAMIFDNGSSDLLSLKEYLQSRI